MLLSETWWHNHPFDPPLQPSLPYYQPSSNPLHQHNLSTHPINTPSQPSSNPLHQHILSTHPINTPSQPSSNPLHQPIILSQIPFHGFFCAVFGLASQGVYLWWGLVPLDFYLQRPELRVRYTHTLSFLSHPRISSYPFHTLSSLFHLTPNSPTPLPLIPLPSFL